MMAENSIPATRWLRTTTQHDPKTKDLKGCTGSFPLGQTRSALRRLSSEARIGERLWFCVVAYYDTSIGLEYKTRTWHETHMLIHLRDRDVDRWTLRQVLERGTLAFECRKCAHLAQLDVLDLVGRFGPEMPVGSVRAKTVCRMCGGRRVRSLVRLKVGRKALAWVPVPPRAGR